MSYLGNYLPLHGTRAALQILRQEYILVARAAPSPRLRYLPPMPARACNPEP